MNFFIFINYIVCIEDSTSNVVRKPSKTPKTHKEEEKVLRAFGGVLFDTFFPYRVERLLNGLAAQSRDPFPFPPNHAAFRSYGQHLHRQQISPQSRSSPPQSTPQKQTEPIQVLIDKPQIFCLILESYTNGTQHHSQGDRCRQGPDQH